MVPSQAYTYGLGVGSKGGPADARKHETNLPLTSHAIRIRDSGFGIRSAAKGP
jgi:hypothetical protein